MRNKIIRIAVVFMLITIGTTQVTRQFVVAETTLGTIRELFPDVKLAQAVVDNLGDNGVVKASIDEVVTQEELDVIQYFGASDLEIDSIEGIGAIRNMTMIMLDNNNIQDIQPLAGLPLTTIVANNNKIESIEVIKSFNELTSVHLNENNIKDPSAAPHAYKNGSHFPGETPTFGTFDMLNQEPVIRQSVNHVDGVTFDLFKELSGVYDGFPAGVTSFSAIMYELNGDEFYEMATWDPESLAPINVGIASEEGMQKEYGISLTWRVEGGQFNYSSEIILDIIPASADINYVNEAHEDILPVVEKTGSIGETFEFEEKSIEGYTLKRVEYDEYTDTLFREAKRKITLIYVADEIVTPTKPEVPKVPEMVIPAKKAPKTGDATRGRSEALCIVFLMSAGILLKFRKERDKITD